MTDTFTALPHSIGNLIDKAAARRASLETDCAARQEAAALMSSPLSFRTTYATQSGAIEWREPFFQAPRCDNR